MCHDHDNIIVRNLCDVFNHGSELIDPFILDNHWSVILNNWDAEAKQKLNRLSHLPEKMFIRKVDEFSSQYKNTSASVSFVKILDQFNDLKEDIRNICEILDVEVPTENDLLISSSHGNLQ